MREPMSITIQTRDGKFKVRSHYDHKLKEILKSIDGRKWNAENRTWDYPAGPASANALSRILRDNGYPYVADDAFVQYATAFVEAQRGIAADEEPPDIPGCKTEPFRHQKVAFWMMAKLFGDKLPQKGAAENGT
jgi:hypothetical protein